MKIKLKELREKEKISLNKLKNILKEEYDITVSDSQLMYYENEIRKPRDENIWSALADHFGVSVAYLLGHEDEQNILKIIYERSKNMKTALTIAGSDCSGGAGIQADIKTMSAHYIYAMSAITALTAQNTLGVTDILEVSPSFLLAQLDAIFTDIFPDAVKIGMVSSAKLIEVIAERLCYYKAQNIVVDPVMVSTSGSKLIQDDALDVLKEKLFPIATVITPNVLEAEILSDIKIDTNLDMENAAKKIANNYNCSVLIKGGHNINDANDFLFKNGKGYWFYGNKIDNPNTHGTGCTLSSAIASNLASGMELKLAVENAKKYISDALLSQLNLGKGSGPLNHFSIFDK